MPIINDRLARVGDRHARIHRVTGSRGAETSYTVTPAFSGTARSVCRTRTFSAAYSELTH